MSHYSDWTIRHGQRIEEIIDKAHAQAKRRKEDIEITVNGITSTVFYDCSPSFALDHYYDTVRHASKPMRETAIVPDLQCFPHSCDSYSKKKLCKRVKFVARFQNNEPQNLQYVGFQMQYKETDGLRIFRPKYSGEAMALYYAEWSSCHDADFLQHPKPIGLANGLKPYLVISVWADTQRCYYPNVPPILIAEVIKQIYEESDHEHVRNVVAFEIMEVVEEEYHKQECPHLFSNVCSCECPYQYAVRVQLFTHETPNK